MTSPLHAASSNVWQDRRAPLEEARGRLPIGAPIAIIDIGSNSVRLVAYEGAGRAPTPIFNEKAMCGLGRSMATSRRLPEDAIDKTLAALQRFRILCDVMGVQSLRVVATAAAREAENGPDFIAAARAACGAPIDLLSGPREAELAALGVVAGFHRPDGVVGDLGGGSLELTNIRGGQVEPGVSLPLGGLALIDRTGGSLKKAVRFARATLAAAPQVAAMRGRTFYAVGGTWRSLARLHMRQRGYPLNVMHGYAIPAQDAADFASVVERADAESLAAIDAVAEARRPLLAYGAVVLEQIIRRGHPAQVVISALGVREGLIYESLPEELRAADPLLVAAGEFNILRSRAPGHGDDLLGWTDGFMASSGLDETAEERRLRHAACLLADIGWRAHPDYRGEQSLNLIANAAFVGVDHPGRAYLALSVFYRHVGLGDTQLPPQLRELLSARLMDRARILGALMRVAYLVSASMPDVLPRTTLRCDHGRALLRLPLDLAALASERLQNRLKHLARVVGCKPRIEVAAEPPDGQRRPMPPRELHMRSDQRRAAPYPLPVHGERGLAAPRFDALPSGRAPTAPKSSPRLRGEGRVRGSATPQVSANDALGDHAAQVRRPCGPQPFPGKATRFSQPDGQARRSSSMSSAVAALRRRISARDRLP